MRVAVYARVSTNEQTAENQLLELRHVEARGWTGIEYVDTGVSGAKDPVPLPLVRGARRSRRKPTPAPAPARSGFHRRPRS